MLKTVRLFQWISCLMLLGMLSGCMSGPDYKRPDAPVPEKWQQQTQEETSDAPTDISEWWTLFGDDVLTDLIEQASRENLDLKTAFSRIEEAVAVRGIARGEYFPTIDGVGGAGATRISDVNGGNTLDNRSPDLFTVGLDASWEIDFWGRIRRSVQSADASLQASIEDYRDFMTILYAQVANSYLTMREYQMRIMYLKDNIKKQADTQKLTQGRYDAGLVPALDVHQAELNLSRTESSLPTMQQQLSAEMHRLAVLLGQSPGELIDRLEKYEKVPNPDFDAFVGLPADLLRQRPDVRRAEQELIAQNARIGVAKADLLPRISLSGSFALEANESGQLSDSGSQTYRFGPTFRWALFQGGRIRSNIQAEEARTEQAMLQYQQTVLLALEDVENAFVGFHQEKDRLKFIQQSVVSAEKSVSQVRTLYENGLVNFLNVLDAERSLAEQHDFLAQSAGQLSRNIVSIYRSLGGGWDIPDEDNQMPTPPDDSNTLSDS